MKLLLSGVIAATLLALAAPAIAAPCQTRGERGANAVRFPTRNNNNDVTLARAMVPAIIGAAPSAKWAPATCERGRFRTPLGEYVVTGENDDALPRRAVRTDGGPYLYLASPDPKGQANRRYVLVLSEAEGIDYAMRFFEGMPSDEDLIDAMRRAMDGGERMIRVDSQHSMITYSFLPPSAAPPPVPRNQRQADGTTVSGGPQVFVAAEAMQFMERGNPYHHLASNFACPEEIPGVPVMLKEIQAHAEGVRCSYRVGTEVRYDPRDEIRYQIQIQTDTATAEAIAAQFRRTMPPGTRERPAPALPAGPALDFQAVYGDGPGRSTGAWIMKRGKWIAMIRIAYPTNAANDAEAAVVARALLEALATQVR